MITFADRLWLAWKILRGRLVDYRADANAFRVTLDFTGKERSNLGQRLRRHEGR